MPCVPDRCINSSVLSPHILLCYSPTAGSPIQLPCMAYHASIASHGLLANHHLQAHLLSQQSAYGDIMLLRS